MTTEERVKNNLAISTACTIKVNKLLDETKSAKNAFRDQLDYCHTVLVQVTQLVDDLHKELLLTKNGRIESIRNTWDEPFPEFRGGFSPCPTLGVGNISLPEVGKTSLAVDNFCDDVRSELSKLVIQYENVPSWVAAPCIAASFIRSLERE